MGSAPSKASTHVQKKPASAKDAKAKELDDAAFGKQRDAIKRGNSINARVDMTSDAVNDVAERMEDLLNKKYEPPPKGTKPRKNSNGGLEIAGSPSGRGTATGSELWRFRVHQAMEKAHRIISTLTLLSASDTDANYQGAYQLLYALPANMADVVMEDHHQFRKEWNHLMKGLREVALQRREEAKEEAKKLAEAEAKEKALHDKFEDEYHELVKENGELLTPRGGLLPPLEGPQATTTVGTKPKRQFLRRKQQADAAMGAGVVVAKGNAARNKKNLNRRASRKDEPAAAAAAAPKEEEIPYPELDAASDHVEEMYRRTESLRGDRIEMSALSPAEQGAVEALGLLTTHLNRRNNKWVADQQWKLPPPQGLRGRRTGSQPDSSHGVWKSTAVEALKSGQVAVHLEAVEPVAPGTFFGDLQAPPLLMTDPWDLKSCLNDEGASLVGEHISGLCMMGRLLLQLVRATEAAGGAGAAKKLVVCLHVGCWFEEQVVSNLVSHGFYGLEPTLVVLVSQPRLHGYVWDDAHSQFVEDASMDTLSIGTGYSFKQLTWAGEAKIIDETGSAQPLELSAADFMINCGVKFMQCSQVDDPYRLSIEGALDMDMLAMAVRKNQEGSHNMVVETIAGKLNTNDHLKTGIPLQPQAEGMSDIDLRSCVIAKASSLMNPVTTEMLKKLHNDAESGTPSLCTSRYVVYLPIVKKALKEALLTPTLTLRARHIFPTLHVEDVTQLRGVNLCAVDGGGKVDDSASGRGGLARIRKPEDVYYLLQQIAFPMDRDTAFQQALSRAMPDGGDASSIVMTVGDMARFKAVVCVSHDAASIKAFAAAEKVMRAGVDRLHLLTVANNSSEVPRGQKVISLFKPQDKLLEVVRDVKSAKSSSGVSYSNVEAIDDYCAGVGCNLVVFGSERLTQGTGNMIGSMALAGIKGLGYSFLLVKRSAMVSGPAVAMTYILLVNHHDLGTLEFAMDFVVPGKDKLVLVFVSHAEGDAGRLETIQGERLLQRMEGTAMRRGIRPARKMVAHPNVAKAFVQAGRDEKADVLVIKDPWRQRTISDLVQDVVTTTPSAVLLHRPEQ